MELLDSDLVGLSVTARGSYLGVVVHVWGEVVPLIATLGRGRAVPLTRTRVLPDPGAAREVDLDLDPALLASAPRLGPRPDRADLALLELHFGMRDLEVVSPGSTEEPDLPLAASVERISPGAAAAALDSGAFGAQRFSDHAFESRAGVATGPAPRPATPLSVAGPDVVRAYQGARAERAARDASDHTQALDLSTPSDPSTTAEVAST